MSVTASEQAAGSRRGMKAHSEKVKAYQEAGADVGLAPDALVDWIERRSVGAKDRAKFEHIWHLCQAFVQGHQWVGWDPDKRRVIELVNPDDRVRHTVNIITQHVTTQQGKLVIDDSRPDVTFRREDVESEAIARQAQKAFEYGWDEEFRASQAHWRASMKRLTYGLGAVRVRFDPTWGPYKDSVPLDAAGDPIMDNTILDNLAQNGTMPDGSLPKFKKVRAGRVLWEPLGPFHFITPPGVDHEDDFPWLIVERPVPVSTVKTIYGSKASKITAEPLKNIDTSGMGMTGSIVQGGKLLDHVLVRTGYEMPTDEHPKGYTIVWAQNTILLETEGLPVELDGQGYTGIRFLKYLPVEGRFWPVGLVQPLVGVQQQRNQMRSLAIEIIERGGYPWLMAHKNVVTERNKLQGIPFQLMEITPGAEFPQRVEGIGPGGWIQDQVEMNDNDARQVTGTGDASLSQPAPNVSAYAYFAAMIEQDDRRVGPIKKADRSEIVMASKFSLALMRKYWGPDKMVAIAGQDGLMDSMIFDATKLPDCYFVDFPESAPLPQSQAAVAQMIIDVFDRGISSGQTLPLDWLVDSYLGGKMEPLPKREMQVQQQTAEYENLLLAQGQVQLVQVKPFDNDQLHVQYHRAAQQAYAMIPGYEQTVQALEAHIQQHLASAEQKAMQQAPTNNGQVGTPPPMTNSPNKLGLGAGGGMQPQIGPAPPAPQ